MKPKTRENVTADMKLKCFSVTILDSLCGMVSMDGQTLKLHFIIVVAINFKFFCNIIFQITPLFNITIVNIKLATHGRWEAMNAVLVSSIAASTFNAQLESWEPLVEPFDGIFK